MEITAIDKRGWAGISGSWFRLGEVYMTNTTSMVTNILAAAGQNRITRLNIIDHGNRRTVQIGDDVIGNHNLRYFSGTLSLLRGHFAPEGFVHLQHCNIGNNFELLSALARIWQVSVYAGTGVHNTVYRFNTGEYVRCDTNGNCYRDVGRPQAQD